jgi:hypothetical protein
MVCFIVYFDFCWLVGCFNFFFLVDAYFDCTLNGKPLPNVTWWRYSVDSSIDNVCHFVHFCCVFTFFYFLKAILLPNCSLSSVEGKVVCVVADVTELLEGYVYANVSNKAGYAYSKPSAFLSVNDVPSNFFEPLILQRAAPGWVVTWESYAQSGTGVCF